MNSDNDNKPRLITLNDVCKLTTLSRTAINKFRFAGNFPIEVNMGDRRIAFVRVEIEQWIDRRITARAKA